MEKVLPLISALGRNIWELGPFVGSTLQERHGSPGTSPAKEDVRANMHKLKHMKFYLNIGKHIYLFLFFFPMGLNKLPRRLWGLSLWRHSNPAGHNPGQPALEDPIWERTGLNDFRKFIPISDILWGCDLSMLILSMKSLLHCQISHWSYAKSSSK